jgi:glycosyltransferase involved in cell wall biosynthesis
MKEIAIYNINTSPGVRVIINNLNLAFERKGYFIKEVDNCNDPNIIYIPYGPKCAYVCAKNNRQVLFDLMVDYLSYGCKNRALSILRNGYFFQKIFWKELLMFSLYYYREYIIFKKLDGHFFVSYNDILRIQKRFPSAKCYYVPNGCTIPVVEKKKIKSDKIRLGVLSNWTNGTLADVRWFIEKYLPKIKNIIPEIEFFIAGKCEDDRIKDYFDRSPVTYLGWVNSLDDFFANIDIYVATVPKGCGVLNKVLDAFAHKTFSIGHKRSFTGFYGLNNGYIECASVDDYINAIKLYNTNQPLVNTIVNNAYDYIVKTNNWKLNYDKFLNDISVKLSEISESN